MTIKNFDGLGPQDYARLLKTGEATVEELQRLWQELIARRPIDAASFAAKTFPLNELPLEFLKLIDAQVLASGDDALKTLWLRALLGRNSGGRCLEVVASSQAAWRMVPMFASTAFSASTEDLQRVTSLYPESLDYIVEAENFVPTGEQLQAAVTDMDLALLLARTKDAPSRLRLFELLSDVAKLDAFLERVNLNLSLTDAQVDFILSRSQSERAVFLCLPKGSLTVTHDLLAPYQTMRTSSYAHRGISLCGDEIFVAGARLEQSLSGLQGHIFQLFGIAASELAYDEEREGYVGKILS